MLKTRKNAPDKLLDASVFGESEYKESKQIDESAQTILTLRKKVDQLEQQFAQAQHFAHHDELTGLPNRALLKDRLNQALKRAARDKTQVALLLLDLDDFKKVNDTFGHQVGDELLSCVAERLLSSIRSADSAYRYGGDEFIVLLPEVDGQRGSIELMQKLQARLAIPYSISQHSIQVSTSIGIAVYPADGASQPDLINRADTKMYLAKSDSKSLI